MSETDLQLLSLVVFTPAAFALGLLVFPRRAVEAMRWWALFGTAATLVLSLCLFIDYYQMIDGSLDAGGRPLRGAGTSLEARADAAMTDALATKPRLSRDCLARLPWIDRFHIDYYLGVDGISLPLVLLSAVLFVVTVIASWSITHAVKGYLALLLLLETGVMGAFLALDFFLFYVFYEVMLLPMFFLIGLWGGPRRQYAALKFFLYTLTGSILILIAMLACYFTDVRDFVPPERVALAIAETQRANPGLSELEADAATEIHTFDLIVLQKAGRAAYQLAHLKQAVKVDSPGRTAAGDDPIRLLAVDIRLRQPFFRSKIQYALFLLLFVGFAVKVPVVPLHTWLPDAHVEAPTPVSMILAGVLLKLGAYGMMRIAWPLCPWAAEQLAWYLALFGVINIVYGAFVAMGQTDFKKLLAYSSVSHMGYVVLGLAAWSVGSGAKYWAWAANGALFQMVAHGITAAGLFFVVGVVYDRAHHRDLNRFGGLMGPMPIYGGLSAVLFFASLGLPGLCGFVGEVFVILGTWQFNPVFAVLAALTTVLTAAYLLWTFQRVYLGTSSAAGGFADVSLREALCLLPLVGLAVALGVLPGPLLLSWSEPSVTGLVDALSRLRP